MRPYYEHAGITIYHGDCREVLPYCSKNAALCADPPYGIDYDPSWKTGAGLENSFSKIVGDDAFFDPTPLLSWNEVILWGANNFTDKLPVGGWIVWDKRCSSAADRMFGASFEMAWIRQKKLTICRILHGGTVNADSRKNGGKTGDDPRFHPTQKPIALMQRCISLLAAELVIDPYCGSGSTLIAAKLQGKSAIGIEIEEKYCEIAAKRLAQEVLEFTP